MATNIPGQITALSAISSIDRTADLLEIVDVSANTSFNVTVNNLLGISGSVLGTTDTQNVSNKTLGNTNVLTVLDGNFTLQDNVDPTKQAQFQLSGNTTGTTRVYTLPDATGTFMDLASGQTAANKTFTTPVLNGGTLNGVTISANVITGSTTSNTGNIYGIAVTTGVITGANTIGSGAISPAAVGSTALATNAVQGSQIATNAINLGSSKAITAVTVSSATLAAFSTPLTTTVTVPAGGRDLLIVVSGAFAGATTNNGYSIAIMEGSTILGLVTWSQTTGGSFTSITCMAHVVAPSAGSHTYSVFGAGSSATTLTMEGGTGTVLGTGPVNFIVQAL